ncbi:MAG TPA: hypothetical protein VHX44_06265 [Planctomycetota bacterium]|nr:hypothetical protein [Planctomycetota bacterium]
MTTWNWLILLTVGLISVMQMTAAATAADNVPAPPSIPGKSSWYVSRNTTSNNWSKTGMYYEGRWQDNVDCLVGGNTTLELYVKALTPQTIAVFNDKKLSIGLVSTSDATHPPAASGVVLGKYCTVTDQNWTRVAIPLADFAGVDLRHVIMFAGLPQALGTGDYAIGIDEVRFIGGAKPLLWYGDAHPNNPTETHGAGMEVAYVTSGGVEVGGTAGAPVPEAAK